MELRQIIFIKLLFGHKRGVELGDNSQNRMMALGLDRYLLNKGQKQVFASQASMPNVNPNACWCLEPIETSFPDDLRIKYAGKSKAQAFEWLTPQGSVPGFW
jgi:hypothetical protein